MYRKFLIKAQGLYKFPRGSWWAYMNIQVGYNSGRNKIVQTQADKKIRKLV